MKDETKGMKEGYEIIVRNKEGVELHRETYPLNSAISIIKHTYYKKNKGWFIVETIFNNFIKKQ